MKVLTKLLFGYLISMHAGGAFSNESCWTFKNPADRGACDARNENRDREERRDREAAEARFRAERDRASTLQQSEAQNKQFLEQMQLQQQDQQRQQKQDTENQLKAEKRTKYMSVWMEIQSAPYFHRVMKIMKPGKCQEARNLIPKYSINTDRVNANIAEIFRVLVHDRSLAVTMAAKTHTVPCGGEVRVVHTPTGEVIFRKRNDCGCVSYG